MKNSLLRGLLVSTLLATGVASAQVPQADEPKIETPSATVSPEARMRELVQKRLGAGEGRVTSVQKTPYAGLWEVRIGSEIVYTDQQANYLFVGNVINTRTRENLTQARIDEVSQIKFTELPLNLAVKTVKGKGERVMAVFADPNCGYCKRFEKTLADIDNVTVYTFLYPILSDDSRIKSQKIWCAANPDQAWTSLMVDNKPVEGAGDCATPIDKVLEFGKKNAVTGTPTLFFMSGKRVPGAIPGDQLEALLAQAPPAKK